ncbi:MULTISPECIES: protein-glutamate methylesterase/protein-glutamine glutaminase [Methylomonas]|uniref:Protein-glutamate methylesterase/protein-glutamine glutaminase n=2 Tax=Methylomonas TaxID=416 RepID=A0A126T5J7_9GAMM|nr:MULTISPECIES: chemotaxis response regulator protein-glutamate methylesterase [Methylomonas]AMK77342.1 chemotaxis response regulator protein-glutamate methylesterase [Methylomonas denitrificans]OAI08823.1 chemotaxis response regulator protein-glutamate methylesterase [Methylomonas methanica]TCV75688.1 two-component system chemotaxis response regulator CheB [Methylomonas methanica]
MTIRVLIVDDSSFICKRIREILEEDQEFKVIGVAHDGREAVELATSLQPDVITMDVEMPVMDGITAVKKIMTTRPCPILMFSAMTQVGAQATLDALSAGAIDFLPKQLEDIDANRETARYLLRYRVRMVASQAARMSSRSVTSSLLDERGSLNAEKPLVKPIRDAAVWPKAASNRKIDLLVVAASTGGPVAMQYVLSKIPADCSIPILLVQHMPPNFTKSFAERLNLLCSINVREAQDGDVLQPGTALLGPGAMQMQVKQVGGVRQIALRPKQTGEIYSPSVDITFSSLAEVFTGHVLAVVLTGMGADGKAGAMQLRQRGAQIWAQDEATSTIYGMPKAIAEAGLADRIYSLDEIANQFKKLQ